MAKAKLPLLTQADVLAVYVCALRSHAALARTQLRAALGGDLTGLDAALPPAAMLQCMGVDAAGVPLATDASAPAAAAAAAAVAAIGRLALLGIRVLLNGAK